MYTDHVVSLASFDREDLPRVLGWVNDPELGRALDRVRPVTSLEHDHWYEALVTRTDAVTFVIRQEGQSIGLCGLTNIHPRHRHAELWMYIGDSTHRGRGLGRRVAALLLRFAFEQLNLHRVHLYAAAYNQAAIRLYQSSGFQLEGRQREHLFMDGRYHDAVRMGVLREEWSLRHWPMAGTTAPVVTVSESPQFASEPPRFVSASS